MTRLDPRVLSVQRKKLHFFHNPESNEHFQHFHIYFYYNDHRARRKMKSLNIYFYSGKRAENFSFSFLTTCFARCIHDEMWGVQVDRVLRWCRRWTKEKLSRINWIFLHCLRFRCCCRIYIVSEFSETKRSDERHEYNDKAHPFSTPPKKPAPLLSFEGKVHFPQC